MLVGEVGGKCLDDEYKGIIVKHKWKCGAGHIWQSEARMVKDGFWCRECYKARKRTSIAEIRDLVASKGGELLTEDYLNEETPLRIRCPYGHEWETCLDKLKNAGRWCPQCGGTKQKSEHMCRTILKSLTGLEFPKCKPEWLARSKILKLELDGYNEENKIAFEYHGEQHYRPGVFRYKYIASHDKQFAELKARDIWKAEKCREQGVLLLEISFFPDRALIRDCVDIIARMLKENNVPFNLCYDVSSFQIAKIPSFEKVIKIIKEKGGELLSPIWRSDYKVLIRCHRGHEWNVIPESIVSGRWCLECARCSTGISLSLTLEDCKQSAACFGGKCLSGAYVNAQTKMEWKCNQGHIWDATANYVRTGHWCRKCADSCRGEKRRINKTQKITTDDLSDPQAQD
jgi:hypothetical protein